MYHMTRIWVLAIAVFSLQAHGFGGENGGGGDSVEIRVDDIRADILKWINDGGAQGFQFPTQISLADYQSKMSQVLVPQAVVLTSVTSQQEKDSNDDEQKVIVNGEPKTCRGFVSKKDQLRHILCNQERFAATSAADQYQLVHHEYAGLVGIEKNIGAASDYTFSRQLVDYLSSTTSLKLSITKNFRNVCLRNASVRNAIELALQKNCAQVTAQDLLNLGPQLRLDVEGPLDENDFQGFQNVRDFDLRLDGQPGFPIGLFRDMSAVEKLQVQGMGEVKNEDFKNFVNLQELVISGPYGNPIAPFPSNLFDGVKSLKKLLLADLCTSISLGSLDGLVNLETLSLHGVQLNNKSAVPAGAFRKLQNLKILEIAYFTVIEMSNQTFQGLDRLEQLGFVEVNISELPDAVFKSLKSLVQVDLSSNHEVKIADGAFSSENFSSTATLWTTEESLSDETRKMLKNQLGDRLLSNFNN